MEWRGRESWRNSSPLKIIRRQLLWKWSEAVSHHLSSFLPQSIPVLIMSLVATNGGDRRALEYMFKSGIMSCLISLSMPCRLR